MCGILREVPIFSIIPNGSIGKCSGVVMATTAIDVQYALAATWQWCNNASFLYPLMHHARIHLLTSSMVGNTGDIVRNTTDWITPALIFENHKRILDFASTSPLCPTTIIIPSPPDTTSAYLICSFPRNHSVPPLS